MVSHRSIVWMLTASLLLSSCRSFDSDTPIPDAVIEPSPIPETSTPAPDHVTEIRNAEYQLGIPDALRVVQLTDGKFEEGVATSADFVSVSVTDFVAIGDLDADGSDEVAALFTENYGGSGVFVFLAVYEDVNGRLSFQTSVLVDDRAQLNELSIENGEISLDATIHGVDEPMCCPTFRTTRHYLLMQNGQLDITDFVSFTPDGKPRTITIESPADGTEVFSSVHFTGNVSIAPFENNLVYRIYDVGGVELSAGAVSVTAPEAGAPGTFDTVISLGNILSGAVIRIEIQDLSAADGSLLAMDSVELVVK